MQPTLQMLIAQTADLLGLAGILRRLAAKNSSLVLTFNRVLPRDERLLCYDSRLVVTEAAFIALLQLLQEHYEIAPLTEVLTRPGSRSGRPQVALTFDDGWEDTYRIAFPHLLQANIPATIFLCTGMIDTNWLLPEERFARIWDQCTAHALLDELVVDLRHWGLGRLKDPGVRPQKHYWFQEMQRMPVAGRLLLLDHFEGRYATASVHSRRFLTWTEIRAMIGTGLVTVGSHTHRHATLTSENDRDIRLELETSRQKLWEHTGTHANMISYPNGMWNRRTVNIVQSTAGFSYGLTGQSGTVSAHSNPYCIPRIAVQNAVDDTPLIQAKGRSVTGRTSAYFLGCWLRSSKAVDLPHGVDAPPESACL